MKTTLTKIIFSLIFLMTMGFTFAQSPQAFNYQAVARDASGSLLVSQALGIRVSLHKGSASGGVVYSELFAPTTNEFGLFTLAIGTGTIIDGQFDTIAWGKNQYWMQVEMDPAGGVAYTDMGTTQLLSVPYAMNAQTAEKLTEEVAFYAYNAIDVTVSNTGWKNYIQYNTEVYDIGDNFQDTVFTAPVAGIYNFSARNEIGGLNIETFFSLSIHVNDNLYTRFDKQYTTSTTAHVQSSGGSVDMHLNAGDKVNIGIYMNSDPSYIIQGTKVYNYFTGHLVYKD
ncbi:MAG TPA: hypothetical protein PKI01_11120 [Bacteroidales bacterium]|nr:hypothetical protein [Bacteroidales bacterium]